MGDNSGNGAVYITINFNGGAAELQALSADLAAQRRLIEKQIESARREQRMKWTGVY